MIADSFTLLPVGEPLPTGGVWLLVGFGTEMFANAVRIALPAMTALLIVNIAFGVVSRAAPTLNLFAVGLPASLLVGFLLLILNIGHLSTLLGEMLEGALARIVAMLGA